MPGLEPIIDFYEETLEEQNKKGWGPVCKELADYIIANLGNNPRNKKKKIKLTPQDIEYGDGYFIFATGDNTNISFRIKEIPGWLFGIWLQVPDPDDEESKKQRQSWIKVSFFSQWEDAIDKFKPSRSNLLVTENFDLKVELDEEGYPTGKVAQELDYACYEWDMYDINRLVYFMYKYPELAFVRDYEGVDFNIEYMDRDTAKKKFEDYKAKAKLFYEIEEEYTQKILSFVKERALKWYNIEPYIDDRGEGWSPRYELVFPLEDINAQEKEEPLHKGSYYIGDDKQVAKDIKQYNKIKKEYEKKVRDLPHWLRTCFDLEHILVLPKEDIDELRKESEKNK